MLCDWINNREQRVTEKFGERLSMMRPVVNLKWSCDAAGGGGFT